jgi:hypothetical protein
VPAIDCDWKTIADWVALTAQDPDVFDHLVSQSGSSYVRICDDGTIWLNATLVDAFLQVP